MDLRQLCGGSRDPRSRRIQCLSNVDGSVEGRRSGEGGPQGLDLAQLRLEGGYTAGGSQKLLADIYHGRGCRRAGGEGTESVDLVQHSAGGAESVGLRSQGMNLSQGGGGGGV